MKLAGEAVAVDQCHEELEVFFFAVIGRGRNEQEVSTVTGDGLAQPVALGILDLAAVNGGRHSVRFVTNNQIVFTRLGKLGLQI